MLQQMDAVGLMTLDTKVRAIIPPKASPKHLLRVLTTLEKTEPGQETAMALPRGAAGCYRGGAIGTRIVAPSVQATSEGTA